MISMDRNASSPISAMEPEKPKHPRFEAYVMTGDTILNLSRTTHSPGSFPIHSKRRKYVPPSNTVPTSPINPIPAPAEKLGEMETVTDPILAKNDIPRLVRTSESEENVHNCKEIQKSSEPNKEEVIPSSSNGETATTDRIVWTYNAPMSEQEVRRLEADQFWSSTRREAPAKLPKLRDSSEHNSESQVDQLIETSNTRDTANETDNSTARTETPLEAGVFSSEDGSPSGSPLLSKPSIPTDEDSDADSLQSVHYSPKGVDMPSAIRLAKRYLLNLLMNHLNQTLVNVLTHSSGFSVLLSLIQFDMTGIYFYVGCSRWTVSKNLTFRATCRRIMISTAWSPRNT